MKVIPAQGSPPRMRGKVDVLPEIDALIGITPAYAGKSLKLWQLLKIVGDHPRVCGEKVWFIGWMACIIGSPPRMRGKVRY